jgi:hypothetical protein
LEGQDIPLSLFLQTIFLLVQLAASSYTLMIFPFKKKEEKGL